MHMNTYYVFSFTAGHTGTPTLVTALEGKGVVTLSAGAL